ncbi:hypothetical protein [uncultured Chitinophaga sp.]|nr:hypothetical protein [uncultured Chitinophaga sp.]
MIVNDKNLFIAGCSGMFGKQIVIQPRNGQILVCAPPPQKG